MQHQALIERIAREMGAHRNTLALWRTRGHVAHSWRLPIAERAAALGVRLVDGDFNGIVRRRELRAHDAGSESRAGLTATEDATDAAARNVNFCQPDRKAGISTDKAHRRAPNSREAA